jgi:hypothetical protein
MIAVGPAPLTTLTKPSRDDFLIARHGSSLIQMEIDSLDGVSASGKPTDFDSVIRRFNPCHPIHFL